MDRRWCALIAMTWLASWVITTAAAEDSSWSVAEVGSMRVVTDSTPAVASQTLEGILAIRSMLQQITGFEPSVPVTVFALKDTRSLSQVAPAELKRDGVRMFGFSHSAPDAAFIALRMDRTAAQTTETLRHEYVHVLTAARLPEAPPWLDEGLSEFWASIVTDGARVIVGRPVAAHLDQLRKRTWLPIAAVLERRRGDLQSKPDQLASFYAQSWAMVHYLLLGPGTRDVPAFMPASMTLQPQFESTLRQYVSDARFREVAVPWRLPSEPAATVSRLSTSQALAEQANMLVSSPHPDTALPLARRALQINAREPLALEVMGAYYFVNNEPDKAREWFERALSVGPPTHRTALNMALLAKSPADRERYLIAAIRAKSDSEIAWQRLAALLEEDGRLKAARRWCARLWNDQPSWLWLGHMTGCGA